MRQITHANGEAAAYTSIQVPSQSKAPSNKMFNDN